ncbi:MAG TPA: penicillin acylase family protein [Gemmatimonadaceae bacterium]
MFPLTSRASVWNTVALICFFPLCTALAQKTSQELRALARERLAQIDGQLNVAGLDSAVEVRRDQWGVPHIYAKTQHDLFFAQGFVAAQDRLFQMDLWRRIGEGRLAEVLGPSYVARDRFARLLKYRGDMDAEWTSYAPDTRDIATSFVAGINAYIALVRDRPPVEFTLLGYLPEPWTPQVPLQRMAALAMTGNAEYEVLRAQLVNAIGAQRAAALWPTIPHHDLDPAPGLSLNGISTLSLGAYAAAVGPVSIPRVVGSNNWVVSGALTTTGKPLLANDPHRYLDNPSLRYLTHLVGPGWNVIGAGEPGVPGIAAGHNERIGFGFTIVGMDQQDLYVETLGSCGSVTVASAARCYLNGGSWKPLRQVVDTILVKGGAPRVVTLEFTEHGPLVNEEVTKDADGHSRGFALRFVGSEPGTAGYLAQISVNRARDWTSFMSAAARWKLPTENLIYADVDGNIGWIAAGLMPKRAWSGLLPVPGTGGYEWNGFRTVGELPRAFDPPNGYIVTANHDIRPQGYQLPLNFEFATPFRAHRVTQVLRNRGARKFSVQDFERLQHDVYSMQAEKLIPLLLAAARQGGRSARWEYETLAHWDYVMRSDETAPVLFEFWKRALSSTALRRAERNETAQAIVGEGRWIDEWEEPDAPVRLFARATGDSLMLAAMDTAMARLRARLGADSTTWRWGALHTAAFPHKVAAAFDLAPVARGGDGSTVNSTSGPDYRQSSGASYREILDVANWDRSVATSVPGQSGQPESDFYGNLLPLWARGEYFPLLFSRAAVERETKHVLWLKPVASATSR